MRLQKYEQNSNLIPKEQSVLFLFHGKPIMYIETFGKFDYDMLYLFHVPVF